MMSYELLSYELYIDNNGIGFCANHIQNTSNPMYVLPNSLHV